MTSVQFSSTDRRQGGLSQERSSSAGDHNRRRSSINEVLLQLQVSANETRKSISVILKSSAHKNAKFPTQNDSNPLLEIFRGKMHKVRGLRVAATKQQRQEEAKLLEEKRNEAARIIQNAFRRVHSCSSAREQIYKMVMRQQKETKFVLKLQRSWKRKKFRVHVERLVRQKQAAKRIQTLQRRIIAKSIRDSALRARNRHILEKLASISCQAFARMAIQRTSYLHEIGIHIPCRAIQKMVRGRICRRWMQFLNWKKEWELKCLPHVQGLPLQTLRLKAWVAAERGKLELYGCIMVGGFFLVFAWSRSCVLVSWSLDLGLGDLLTTVVV